LFGAENATLDNSLIKTAMLQDFFLMVEVAKVVAVTNKDVVAAANIIISSEKGRTNYSMIFLIIFCINNL
jgi:hypothetical protein